MKRYENGVTECETLEEILNTDISWAKEDRENYYFREKNEPWVYIVNKKTLSVSGMLYPAYLAYALDHPATQIDPKSIKKSA